MQFACQLSSLGEDDRTAMLRGAALHCTARRPSLFLALHPTASASLRWFVPKPRDKGHTGRPRLGGAQGLPFAHLHVGGHGISSPLGGRTRQRQA